MQGRGISTTNVGQSATEQTQPRGNCVLGRTVHGCSCDMRRARGTSRRGFRSFSSRQQLCSAIMRWPILASWGILAIQACMVSSTAPAATSGSVDAPTSAVPFTGGRSAACAGTDTSDTANSMGRAQIIRVVSKVVFIASSSLRYGQTKHTLLRQSSPAIHSNRRDPLLSIVGRGSQIMTCAPFTPRFCSTLRINVLLGMTSANARPQRQGSDRTDLL